MKIPGRFCLKEILMSEETTTYGNAETAAGGEMPFNEWLENQTDEVKTRFNTSTEGLKKALAAERDSNKSLTKQLRELAGKAETGSELAKQLEEITGKLHESERKNAFMDGARDAGCSNPKAAYAIASAVPTAFKVDGSPDWKAIKEIAPELFAKPASPSAKAGAGTKQEADAGSGHAMDDFIRARLHK
jgi:hypothetical protein